jgi:nucleotide-binding universal stress UspA family protein
MKILVPVDPSASAHLAVTRAAEMAKKEGAQLTLLAVAETFHDMENLFGNEAMDRMKQRAASALETAKDLAAGAKPKAILKSGDSPEDIIVDVAEKGGFDLIIMGTRGKKGKTGLRLGSVSSRVVAQAPCSVLVVRSPTAEAEPPGPWTSPRLGPDAAAPPFSSRTGTLALGARLT